METIFVIAQAIAKKGKEREAEQALRDMVAPTRAEPGCILYNLYLAEESGLFFFYEQWANSDALKSHTETSHYRKLLEVAPNLFEGELAVHLLRSADAF
jgi:quinol monooxygenase YgiN